MNLSVSASNCNSNQANDRIGLAILVRQSVLGLSVRRQRVKPLPLIR